MKYTLIALALLGEISAHKLVSHGIPKKEIMQEQPSHWRKVWPQGAIDNADGDADVLNMFLYPEEKKKKKPTITYPYELDEDVISTQDSIAKAEELTNEKLHLEAVHDGGMDMINVYDNTKRQFERNLPYGSTWP